MTEQNEMSAGDACARVAVLEAELAELRNGYMRMRNVAAGYSNLCDADSANARRLEKEFEAVDQAHYRAAPAPVEPFQRRVQAWMLECFGQDRPENDHDGDALNRATEPLLERVDECLAVDTRD